MSLSRSQFVQSVLSAAAVPLADTCKEPVTSDRPQHALVLSGGTARGCYEAGIIQGLLETGKLNYDLLCGTSIGAINAAIVAQGDADKIVDFWKSIPESYDILTPKPEAAPLWAYIHGHNASTPLAYRNAYSAAALSAGAYFARSDTAPLLGIMKPDVARSLLKKHLSLKRVETPLMYVVTNVTLKRAEAFYAGPSRKWTEKFLSDFKNDRALPVQVLSSSSEHDCSVYSETIRASGALTFVFDPVQLSLRFNDPSGTLRTCDYTDGGVLNNTPVRLARRARAAAITAVFLDPRPASTPTVFDNYYPSNILDLGANLYFLTRLQLLVDDMNLAQSVRYPDNTVPSIYEFRPDQTIPADSFDFDNAEAIKKSIEQGRVDAHAGAKKFPPLCEPDTII